MTGPGPGGGPQLDATGGGIVLREMRTARRVSQSRLGVLSGYDHTHMSRIESGERRPTREALGKIATALRLGDAERDELLIAFGFRPERPESTIAGQPEVARLYDLMERESIPPEVKNIAKAHLALIAASMEMWS